MISFRQTRDTASQVQPSNPANAAKLPNVVCQMRIRNEGRWLHDVLESISTVVQGIIILDDGSTDNTPEICRNHPKVIDYVWQNESEIDETRDKNRLLEMALSHKPDWILCMDGDEILEDSASGRLNAAMSNCPTEVSILDLEFLYMWNDMKHYRTDDIYRRIFHHRLFRLHGQDLESLCFRQTCHGGNFHCESVPSNLYGRSMEIDVKIKHLGYMTSEDRIRKYDWYTSKDPIHAAKGYYEHLLDQPGITLTEWQERPFWSPQQSDYPSLAKVG